MSVKRSTSILEHFKDLPDFRVNRTRKHELLDIVVIAICGVISGTESWEDVELFAKAKKDWLGTFLSLPNGIPSHDTFNRIFRRLNPHVFQEHLLGWLQAVSESLGAKGVLLQGQPAPLKHRAIDGKTLRHSFDRASAKSALHLVSAWAVEAELTLGQVAVESKSNEIPAIPILLRVLDLAGALVTIDAMGCQKNIVADIRDAKADYLIGLKDNQPRLFEDVKARFRKRTGEPATAEPSVTTEVTAKEVEAAAVVGTEVVTAKPVVAEVGAAEVGAAEVGAAEVGAAEVGAAEVGAAEVGAAEVGAAEVGAAEVGAAEVGAAEVGAAEVGAAEVEAIKAIATEGIAAEVVGAGNVAQKPVAVEVVAAGVAEVVAAEEKKVELAETPEVYSVHRTEEQGHGRTEIREVHTILNPKGIRDLGLWKGLLAICMVVSTRIIAGKESVERRYYIGSLKADAKEYAAIIRNHWRIENSLHWVLDVTFREDFDRTRKGHGPENLALLRRLAVSLLKNEKTLKTSVRSKRYNCALDEEYLLRVLTGGVSPGE